MGKRLATSWLALALYLPLNLRVASCFSPSTAVKGLTTSCFGLRNQAQSFRSTASVSTSTRMLDSPYATKPYPVGTPGQPWGPEERKQWFGMQKLQRSYEEEVLTKVKALKAKDDFTCEQYGALSINPERYPLFAFKSKAWDPSKPTALVTGGVHGYETSGVQGALLFLETEASRYAPSFNLVVAPCVSPWGYEHIQRWNNNADDPNRNFKAGGPCDESNAIVKLVSSLKESGVTFTCHVDLHETTDTDETEFRPAKSARDGEKYEQDYIPDGFYLVGDSENQQPEWHKAMIESVRKVTHIAPADAKGQIIGEKPVQEGCIVYPIHSLNLCASVTGAPYCTTTEVYPDSPSASDEQCNKAQVACVTGALDYLLQKK
jgi:hypothetical protein